MKTLREMIDIVEAAQTTSNRKVKKKEVEEDQATARMGLMSAVGSDSPDPQEQRRAMAQQAVEQLASKK